MTKRFIDISEHNTILSFNGMFDSNLSGAIIKATEGTTYKDHACEVLYDAIKGKLPLGFYHYLTATSEPETQALNFYTQIKDKEYEILAVLDVEQDKLGNTAQLYTQRFMDEFFKLSGQNMMIYSGRCYIEEHFDVSFRKDNIWWIADYSALECPTINGCNIVAWQYTENSNNYAFNLGDLDVSILIDESKFFIENYIPYSEPPVEKVVSSDWIKVLQNELNEQGFTDKNFKPLIVDGIAGELTLSACPIIQVGCSGAITRWIQTEINMPIEEIDSCFGEITRQAIIVYQENRSLNGDGIVGKNTWKKLLGM